MEGGVVVGLRDWVGAVELLGSGLVGSELVNWAVAEERSRKKESGVG